MKTCWYKEKMESEWKTGFFHQWSTNYEEFDSGPEQFPAAIIEDTTDSQVHVVYAGFVSFSPNHPDRPEPDAKAYVAAILKDDYRLPQRFEPRLVFTPTGVLVQVHPETIEVFNDDNYICQVRWIGGEMDYCQGGLPLAALEDMFKEGLALR